VFHFSSSQWVILIVLSFVWAGLGYRLSEIDRRNLGRTPWGLPSALWALFWFLSLIVGLVLYLIAHSSGVKKGPQNPPDLGVPPMASHAAPVSAPPARGHGSVSVSDLYPAYPRPANTRSAEFEPEPEERPARDDQAGGWVSPPAWQPDPSGRFHYRWWDGSEWTSQVSINGQQLVDTSPDQRIGPY